MYKWELIIGCYERLKVSNVSDMYISVHQLISSRELLITQNFIFDSAYLPKNVKTICTNFNLNLQRFIFISSNAF